MGNLTNGNTLPNIDPNQQQVPGQQHLTAPPDGPALFTLGREQQYAAVQLSHYIYTLLCIISQLMTTNESLQAQIATLRGADGSKQYRHNQQLEELRNLQDKLSMEKSAWTATKEQQEKDIEEKKTELLRLQEQVRAEQNDVNQQREQLYRKMEVLTSQGLLISPNIALPVTGQIDDSSKESSEDSSPQSDSSSSAVAGATGSSLQHSASTTERRKDSKWTNKGSQCKSQLPINLISTTNQQKVPINIPVKQQIPLKLASRLSSGSGSSNTTSPCGGPQQMLPLKLSQDEKTRRISSSGYQRLGSDSISPPSGETTPTLPPQHSRTGSSPALMQASPPGQGQAVAAGTQHYVSSESSKAARTHTYPKLPEKFKLVNRNEPAHSDREAASPISPPAQKQPQQSSKKYKTIKDQSTPNDEEVIYF